MAKARLENGKVIVYSADVPQGWEVLDGFANYYTDDNDNQIGISVGVSFNIAQVLSDADWINFGFYPYTEAQYDPTIQEIDSVSFDPVDEVYFADIVDKTWSQTLANLKATKIANLKHAYNSELSKTDWVIIRDSELGNTTDQTILDDRAALRAECATKEAEINALTTKKNVALYELPNFM